jgi:hypothetical protein|nr:MAG TPA: hypothetical protein [Bacteriophage sp.]
MNLYPDQIKSYTTEEQFLKHRKMLDDLDNYYSTFGQDGYIYLHNIEDEKNFLERTFRNWKRRKAQAKSK